MEILDTAHCRKLIGQRQSLLDDAEVAGLRDMLYSLADVIADAFIDLDNIDQSMFSPPGDAVDVCENQLAELIRRITTKGVGQ